MVVQERLYTSEDLWEISQSDDTKHYELYKGELIEVSPTGKPHGRVTNEISYLLTGFVRLHDLGQVFGAETGFKLAENPDIVYGVDVAFVSKAGDQRGEGDFIGAP